MRLLLRRIVFLIGYLFHRNHDSKVIYYHDVSKKYTDMGTEFGLMLRHIDIVRKSGYKIVPEIMDRKRQVMFCFDDGWAGIYDYKDKFIKQQIFPTIFIAVDLIGKEGYLTEAQILELIKNGFRFQAHTWSHQDLTTFDDKGLKHELRESKEQLEFSFGQTFDAICFPLGRFSEKIKEKCLEFGYIQLFSSLPGGYYDLESKNLICRNCAQNATAQEFKWLLNGRSLIFLKKLMKQHIA